MTPEARLRAGSRPAAATAPGRVEGQVEQAVRRGVDWFLANQDAKGYWWGELEADTTLESDYIFYLHVLGQPESEKIPKLGKVYPRSSASRRRLEHLRGWPCGAERHGQGLGRAAARR